MLNFGELNHEHFEELCALAALGQISSEEFKELQAHLRACVSCRDRHTDFLEILHEHLPLMDRQNESNCPSIAFHDSHYKQRFVERAVREGIRFSDEVLRESKKTDRNFWGRLGEHSWSWRPQEYAFLPVLIILLLVIGVIGYRLHESHSRKVEALARVATLSSEIAKLKLRIGELSESRLPSKDQPSSSGVQGDSTKAVPSLDSNTQSFLHAALSRARNDYRLALDKSRTLEEQLQNVSSELTALRAELRAAKTSGNLWADKLRETELALRQTDELRNLRLRRSEDASTVAAQQAQIRELTEKLSGQADILERERELLAAGRDIRDLMGARNLHIIDVADVDSEGTKRPFGRVFYTEGKSLIFYAYDLERKKNSQEKFSFQAWGQRGARAGSAQSLGIFFADDRTQNRWVLKYDDPKVLAQIDAVFVTIEPKGGSMKPRGEQLMYAYLKANPNHP